MIIETKKLNKSYGKARGITDVSLSVREGDIYGFIGPNGAGKSTTIRILLGLIQKFTGEATLFGKDIRTSKEEILKRIGYMPSEAWFYTGMKVEEIIRLSAKLRKQDCEKEAKDLCDRLQLDLHKRVEELSLGNRKKVSIVCSMMHRPDLYIFDEPTSGLDPLMQKEFFDLLHERQKKGATVFLSSHVLSEIQRHCNRAALIRQGEIILTGTVEELSRTSARRVSIQGTNQVPSLEGVSDVFSNGNSANFLYQGDMKLLLGELWQLPVKDIIITEPDLEEIFMHMYTENAK